jgi:hypothetical protein
MYDRNLGCYYGAIFDDRAENEGDVWIAVKIGLDGIQTHLCRFATQDEAESCAIAEWLEDREANSQFGVGA